jgi:hypothetical protein
MFESEDGRTSTGQPEQEEGSQLQRFLSQLGTPANAGLSGLNSLDLETAVRLPRYYGAPPDHLPLRDSTAYSKVTPGDATDRLNFMLQMAADSAKPSESPANNSNAYNLFPTDGRAPMRSKFEQLDASAGLAAKPVSLAAWVCTRTSLGPTGRNESSIPQCPTTRF